MASHPIAVGDVTIFPKYMVLVASEEAFQRLSEERHIRHLTRACARGTPRRVAVMERKADQYLRQSERAARDIGTWPEWMQRNLNPPRAPRVNLESRTELPSPS